MDKINKTHKKSAELRPSRILFGILLLIAGLLLTSNSSLFNQSSEIDITQTFVSEPIKVDGLSQDAIEDSKVPKRIVIPSLEIDLEVKRSKIINSYWEVFKDSAGWGEGSGIPGQIGNQVIFAHAKPGLFLPLQSIKVGDKVYILTDSDWFAYSTKEVLEVYPKNTEVIASTEDETLTLYTCSGFKDTKRLIVIAKRIK